MSFAGKQYTKNALNENTLEENLMRKNDEINSENQKFGIDYDE